MIPGEIVVAADDVELAPGRPRVHLVVENTGDRPIQVGSHFHFAATNPALSFDRTSAWGYRLDVPAGTAVRFEPGVTRQVSLVALAGGRIVPGLTDALAGALDDGDTEARLRRWSGGSR
jgi:urease subunit beta